MHQGRGLERLPRFLLCEFRCSELFELIVDQRQELLCGVGSPCLISERMQRHVIQGPSPVASPGQILAVLAPLRSAASCNRIRTVGESQQPRR